MFFSKYSLKKTNPTKKLESFSDGNIILSKWIIIIFFILFTAFGAILVVSIVISLTKKPNGLYNESCDNRPCEKKLGLKCIEKICLCAVNQFYIDKCYNLSSFNEICKINDHCKQNELLLCGLKSKCNCAKENYWNNDLKKCLPKKSFAEICDGDQCIDNLICEFGFCKCSNSKLFYWNGTNCLSKKNYGQSCITQSECLSSEDTICLDLKCSCIEKQFFNYSKSKCVPKLSEFETCSDDKMCLEPMFCSNRFECQCPYYFFFESDSSTCNNQYFVDETCKRNYECRQDLGLECRNGKCLCSSPKYTWSSNLFRCKLTFKQSTCGDDLDCNDSESLTCQLSDLNDLSYRTCICKKEKHNESYWDQTGCVQAKTYKYDCTIDDHCRTLTENTYCSTLSKKCECPNLHYWHGQKCLIKKSYLETCTHSYECMDSQLLICNDAKCVCDKRKYFDSNLCVERVGELEPCFKTNMCLKDMMCNYTHCICQNNSYFLNDECVPQKLFNQKCDKDLECWNDKGLICQLNRCVCKISFTWSLKEKECLLTYGQKGCSNSSQCNFEENLKCINEDCNCPLESVGNMCDCNRNSNVDEYWNGSKCIEAKDFNFPCTRDYECKTKTQDTKCINSSCICSNFSIQFWNSEISRCEEKKNYNKVCNDKKECLDSEFTICLANKCVCPSKQYFDEKEKKCLPKRGISEKCYDNICLEPLICDNKDFVCICETDKYYHQETHQCFNQKTFKQQCSKDDECLVKENLKCLNDECSCENSTYTWDSDLKSCKYTYNIICINENDCSKSSKLKCKDYTERCMCPSDKSGKICDCERNKEFWNGFNCVKKKSFGHSCQNSFECNDELVCLDNNCRCEFYQKKEGGDKCKNECYVDTLYYNGKCYCFTNETKMASDSEEYCKKSKPCSNKDFNIANIKNINIETEFTQYLRHLGSEEAYWIKYDGDFKNFRINKFNSDIQEHINLRIICEKNK